MGRPLLRDEVPVGPCKVRALYSWSGETPQDLGFVEGDIIEVLNNGDGDWWTGKLKRNKLVGIFPRNFAEYVDANQETMSAALNERKLRKGHLSGFTLEGMDPLDFSSLADLQIPDPHADVSESHDLVDEKTEDPLTRLQTSLQHPLTDDSPAFEPRASATSTKRRSFVPLSTASQSSLAHSQASAHSQSHSQSHGQSQSRLGASAGSARSTKSAKEILDDIGKELNSGFLDDVNLDAKPEELRTPELLTGEWPATSGGDDTQTSAYSNEPAESNVPAPPPHKVSVNSRKSGHSRAASLVPEEPVSRDQLPKKSSALTGPVLSAGMHPELGFGTKLGDDVPHSTSNGTNNGTNNLLSPAAAADPARTGPPAANSPVLDPQSLDPNQKSATTGAAVSHSPNLAEEIPFDPRTAQIGAHIGSHFDSAAYASPLAAAADGQGASKPVGTSVDAQGPATDGDHSVVVPRTRQKASAPPAASKSGPTVYFPPREEPESRKSNFFQKLFPKNTQTFLRRSVSHRSTKSAKSSRSTKSVTSKIKNLKSMFSFKPDESIYPTNYKPPAPAVPVSTPAPAPTTASTTASTTARTMGGPPLAKPASANRISTPPRPAISDHLGLGLSLGASGSSKGTDPVDGKWIAARRDLYRAKTLSDRDARKRRQELELQGVNCDNLVGVLNEQNALDYHDYRLENFERVDQAVLTMSTWPQLMTPSVFASSRIGRHFSDEVERVRAVFLLCATRIQHVSQTPAGNNVMQTRTATPHELSEIVVAMCSALDIECVAVEGHVRSATAGAAAITSTPHAWNAVRINGEWRLIDAVTAAQGRTDEPDTSLVDDDDDAFVNLFYFLTPPAQLIFSHVPHEKRQQFCEPGLPTATAALLPLASPAAFAHDVSFDEFWLGMTRLADLEVAELSLSVPDTTKDIVALVGRQPALSQAYWTADGQDRHFRIKAFVPPGVKQATMQIYIVPKDQASRSPEAMELLWTVELRHVSGAKNNTPFEFVGRYAAPTAEPYDLYVVEPQCRALGGGDTYTFKVESFKATAEVGTRVPQPRVAIQSPSGRLTRLVPFGTDVHDTFRATVKTLEVGTWRSVVRADDNQSWVPFAEWFCS